MRILDISVATAYALLCLSLVSYMSPYGAAASSAASAADARANTSALQYVQNVGLVYLGTATPAEVCTSLQQHSTATVVLGGTVGTLLCPGGPRSFEGDFVMLLALSGREVKIEAWVVGP